MTLEELITRLKHVPDRYINTKIEIEFGGKFYDIQDVLYFDKPIEVILLAGEEVND